MKKNKIKSISIVDASLVARKDQMTIYRWIKAKKISAHKDKKNYRWIIVLKSLKNYIASKKRRGGEKKMSTKRELELQNQELEEENDSLRDSLADIKEQISEIIDDSNDSEDDSSDEDIEAEDD